MLFTYHRYEYCIPETEKQRKTQRKLGKSVRKDDRRYAVQLQIETNNNKLEMTLK